METVLSRKARTAASFVYMSWFFDPQSDICGRLPEEVVDFAYRHTPIRPGQVKSEILEFAHLVKQRKPKVTVEIGTNNGGTFFVLCRMSDPQAVVISVDLPGAHFSSGEVPRMINRILPKLPVPGQEFHAIRADSHLPSTLAQFEQILRGRAVDLMFIDGDHTYEGVKKDFEMYSPFVRNGGVVAFHDILKEQGEADCEVNRFWNEIKEHYVHKELVTDPKQGWAGIGVLFV